MVSLTVPYFGRINQASHSRESLGPGIELGGQLVCDQPKEKYALIMTQPWS